MSAPIFYIIIRLTAIKVLYKQGYYFLAYFGKI